MVSHHQAIIGIVRVKQEKRKVSKTARSKRHGKVHLPKTTHVPFLPERGDTLQRRFLRPCGEGAAWRPRRRDRLTTVFRLPRRHSRHRVETCAPVLRRLHTLVEALAALDGAGEIGDGVVADAPLMVLSCCTTGEQPAGDARKRFLLSKWRAENQWQGWRRRSGLSAAARRWCDKGRRGVGESHAAVGNVYRGSRWCRVRTLGPGVQALRERWRRGRQGRDRGYWFFFWQK